MLAKTIAPRARERLSVEGSCGIAMSNSTDITIESTQNPTFYCTAFLFVASTTLNSSPAYHTMLQWLAIVRAAESEIVTALVCGTTIRRASALLRPFRKFNIRLEKAPYFDRRSKCTHLKSLSLGWLALFFFLQFFQRLVSFLFNMKLASLAAASDRDAFKKNA